MSSGEGASGESASLAVIPQLTGRLWGPSATTHGAGLDERRGVARAQECERPHVEEDCAAHDPRQCQVPLQRQRRMGGQGEGRGLRGGSLSAARSPVAARHPAPRLTPPGANGLRKPSTFAGLAIPDSSSPAPKRPPAAKDTTWRVHGEPDAAGVEGTDAAFCGASGAGSGRGGGRPRWKRPQPAATTAPAAASDCAAVVPQDVATAACPAVSKTRARRAGTAPTATAVAIPDAMNEPTATRERGEKRASPQTPCPDVQPLPRLVPKPTRAPAISKAMGRTASPASPDAPLPSATAAAPALMRPATKETRQPVSAPSRPWTSARTVGESTACKAIPSPCPRCRALTKPRHRCPFPNSRESDGL